MEILHIDTGAEMRGGQRQVLLLLRGLREAGHQSVLLARNGSSLAKAASTHGFPVHPANVAELWSRSKRFPLVHVHDARAHTMAAMAARTRFVVSRRVAFPVRRSLASRWKYRCAARFLAVSQFVAGELQAAGVPNSKIDVVYDGVEINSGAISWSSQSPVVAIASRDPQKGRDLLERAAHLAQIPVVFSENLPDDLRQASMFVYITRSEGLGSATLLAMSMGVPVVASRVGGLPEVFSDGEAGFLVENTPEAIASAMCNIISHPDLARRLGARGRDRIAESFSRDHLVCRTAASYQRALAG